MALNGYFARADASWSPRGRSGQKWHAATEGWAAACNPNGILLDDSMAERGARLDRPAICNRAACMSAYTDALKGGK